MTIPAPTDRAEHAISTVNEGPWRSVWRIAQTVLAIALVGFAAAYLWHQWRDASAAHLTISVHWGWLLAASAMVLATYAFLIEVWRRVLLGLGSRIAFVQAARIWFVSNLGKYIPGKIWQVTTMAAMLKNVGIGTGIAASASALITIANIAAGFALLLLVGVRAMQTLGERTALGAAIAVIGLLALLLAGPFLGRLISSFIPRAWRGNDALVMPMKATIVSVVGCVIAWVLYGLAFRLLVVALVGHWAGDWSSYVAAYVLSYLVGYLVLVAPGGLGPREAVLSTLLVSLHLASPAEAVVITVASRLWLTALELVPGVIFLGVRQKR